MSEAASVARRRDRDAARPGDAAQAARNPGEALLWLALLPILWTLVFAGGVALGARGDDVTVLGLACITGCLCLVPLALDRARVPEKRHLLLSLMAAAFAVYFVLPVFAEHFWLDETLSLSHTVLQNQSAHDIANGQVMALLGLVCMLLGYAMPFGRLLSLALPRPRRDWSHQTTLAVAIFMIPLGWMLFLAGQFGILPQRLGSGLLGALASSLYFGFALLTIAWLRFRSRPALTLMALLIGPTMAFTFFTGSKKLFLAPLIMIALTHAMVTRRLRVSWLVGGLAAIVVLYPVAQFNREVVQRGFSMNAVQVLRDPGRAVGLLSAFLTAFHPWEYIEVGVAATLKRLDALAITNVIVANTPEPVPYQGGWTIGLIFVSYVPRVLWPDKPKTTFGQWVTDMYGAGPDIKSSTGPSWIGELYFNFGPLGVVVGMLIIGTYFRILHESLLSGPATTPALLLGVAVLLSTAPSLQGGLIAPINGFVYNAIPIAITHLVIVMFSRPSRPRPAPDSS